MYGDSVRRASARHLPILVCLVSLIALGGVWIGGPRHGSRERCETCDAYAAADGRATGGLFDTADFPPRWRCGAWTEIHGWTHILADLAIWAAYMTIPLILIGFVRRRRDIPFASVFWLFGAFILACGLTHLMEALMFRWPAYRLMGALKVLTAVVSWATALVLVPAMEKALRLQNPLAPKLAALVESSADAIVGKTKDGIVTSWNAAAQRLYGYTAEETIGRSMRLVVPPDRAQEHEELLRDVVAGHRIDRAETVRVRKDGSRVDVSLSMSPLLDLAGKVTGAVAVYHDVTDQHRANERIHMAIEAAPNGMLMVEEHGRIVLVNTAVEALFGYQREELIGQPIEILVPEAARPGHPRARDGFFANPRARRMGEGRDLKAVRKDGTPFPVEIGLNPMRTEEGCFVLAAVVDITERTRSERELAEQAARLERSNEELNRFAYAAAHDLKAPLQAIRNLSQWIAEDLAGGLGDETQRHLGLMQGRAQRLEALLNGLLDYARVGSEEGPLEDVDVEVLVVEVVEMLAPPGGFRVTTSGELPRVRSVRAALELVFRNLISNAIKHHDRRDGSVVVSHQDLGERFEFSVADDGPGIDPEHHQRIFEMFQTLRPRDEVEGSGMGLAMIKKVVEGARGSVSVVSGAARGTDFRFTWPKDPAASESRAA